MTVAAHRAPESSRSQTLRIARFRWPAWFAVALGALSLWASAAAAKDLKDMNPAERSQYYGDLLRTLQNLGGEVLTDDLLIRSGPCLDQCPTGLHTFSADRVEEAGFRPKREFHYDREAVAIRTRDEKIHDAVLARSHIDLQEKTFEVVNSHVAGVQKLALYCGLNPGNGATKQGFHLKFVPLNDETWAMGPQEFPDQNKNADVVKLRDEWFAFTEACDLKKLDLFPSEMQLVRLEDFLQLKRKERTHKIFGIADKKQVAALVELLKRDAAALQKQPHVLHHVVANALLSVLGDGKLAFVQDQLNSSLLFYLHQAAQYMESIRDYDKDVAKFDELGQTYEHFQDLLFVYLGNHDRYPSLEDFQRVAAQLGAARIAAPNKVQIVAYPTQSGMDGFATAALGAHHVTGTKVLGNSSFPANMMPLGNPVLNMYPGMYFEARFKVGPQTDVPIYATGLATEFKYDLQKSAAIIKAVKGSAAKHPKTVLIVDDTLVDFKDIQHLDKDFTNSTTALVNGLAAEMSAGKVDVILARSLQKFGSLGTRKTKAGFILIYSATPASYEVLAPLAHEFWVTRRRDFQWVAFNMQYQDMVERAYIQAVDKNATFLGQHLRYPLAPEDEKVHKPPHQMAMRTFVLTDKLELRAQAFRAMPQFGTFGGPFSSHSDLADVERFSPGLEPPDVLLTKLRFWVSNVPAHIRLKKMGEAVIDLRNLKLPLGPIRNNIFYDAVREAWPQAPKSFKLYQSGREIPNSQGQATDFNFDFSKPGEPVDLVVEE